VFLTLIGLHRTSAQLTEGRSARDQPKQPPAKKKGLEEEEAHWPLTTETKQETKTATQAPR